MTWTLKALSAFVCVILVVGYCNRRRRSVHVPLMISALVIDLSMVLYLEITRAVVETIPKRPLTPLLIVHIILSVIVLVLYGVQVVTGRKKWKHRPSILHGKVALWFLGLRFGNLITSILLEPFHPSS
ncbi:MAG: hypothetical protein D6788_11565 [Planctomycetota bacterium]|nr:MAG: hypothetical protein D6788_11565 [Planctomycetota bacterium]